MDWTPFIGRRRPVEDDALRVLAVLHRLGAPASEPGFSTYVAGERRLLWLDHLVRHPVDLAFLLIASYGGTAGPRRRTALVRDVRRLADVGTARERLPGERLNSFRGGTWERWDDVWAYLGCRRLAEVRAAPEGAALEYWLSERGASHLDGLYASIPDLGTTRERCRILRRHFSKAGDSGPLVALADEADRELDAFRAEEHLTPEDDLLSRFFHSRFGESL